MIPLPCNMGLPCPMVPLIRLIAQLSLDLLPIHCPLYSASFISCCLLCHPLYCPQPPCRNYARQPIDFRKIKEANLYQNLRSKTRQGLPQCWYSVIVGFIATPLSWTTTHGFIIKVYSNIVLRVFVYFSYQNKRFHFQRYFSSTATFLVPSALPSSRIQSFKAMRGLYITCHFSEYNIHICSMLTLWENYWDI